MRFSRAEWHMAGKYGTRRDLLAEALSASWERFWLCRIRGDHHEKLDSHRRCYRCGKAMP